jgi:hypothetical protein
VKVRFTGASRLTFFALGFVLGELSRTFLGHWGAALSALIAFALVAEALQDMRRREP